MQVGTGSVSFFAKDGEGSQARIHAQRIVCASPACGKTEVTVMLSRSQYVSGFWEDYEDELQGRGVVRMLPASSAEVFPDYVPLAVRTDYEEACGILDLSPKASATLARRALQGIVRDFFGGKGRSLKDEIDSIQEKCDPLVWEAMTAVREVGNIGAHMERDIGQIIDVEPGEARLLVELIETLVKETYVARQVRAEQMARIKELAAAKKQERVQGK